MLLLDKLEQIRWNWTILSIKMQPCNDKVNTGKGGVGMANPTIRPEQKTEQVLITLYANN